jgi:prevent-host-death family protein
LRGIRSPVDNGEATRNTSDQSGQKCGDPMKTWQVQEAKAQFSEVLRQADQGAPQQITSHGKPVAVVLSHAEYQRLSGQSRSLVEFIRTSPLADTDELELERTPGMTRTIEF